MNWSEKIEWVHRINIFHSALFIVLNNTDYHTQNENGTLSALLPVLLVVRHS